MSAQPTKQTLRCALARARLQHGQLSVLHAELEILHVQQRLLKLMSSACQRLPNRWQNQVAGVAQAFVAAALGLQYAPDGGEKWIAVEGVAGAAQAARDGQGFPVVFGSSTIAVVIFSVFIGLAATGIAVKQAALFASFKNFVDVAQAVIMRMVKMVLRLTPYGVLALMTQVVAHTSPSEILKLLSFVLAFYSALLLMFCIHLALIALVGLNPLIYVKKMLPLLVFAFTSRSSAGAIPMHIQTQTQALGTPAGIANFSASFGATMGQNGCAGIYPAMLAIMIAPTVGIDPFTFNFIATLISVVTIGSIGVAGVGGEVPHLRR